MLAVACRFLQTILHFGWMNADESTLDISAFVLLTCWNWTGGLQQMLVQKQSCYISVQRNLQSYNLSVSSLFLIFSLAPGFDLFHELILWLQLKGKPSLKGKYSEMNRQQKANCVTFMSLQLKKNNLTRHELICQSSVRRKCCLFIFKIYSRVCNLPRNFKEFEVF